MAPPVCIRPVAPGDHDQLEGLYEEMSPENLRLRFFAACHRSARLAADRACASARPGYRALLAKTQGRVIGLAEYDTGRRRRAGRADPPGPVQAPRPLSAPAPLRKERT
jgi:hypothetical protein